MHTELSVAVASLRFCYPISKRSGRLRATKGRMDSMRLDVVRCVAIKGLRINRVLM